MAKNLNELRARMSQEAQTRAQNKAMQMLSEMTLNELRQANDLYQKVLDDALHDQQPSIPKIEN